MWVRNAANSRLAWSTDRARTWTWSNWKFTESFGCPSFLQSGKNYAANHDDYVYIYSPDSDTAYVPADRLVLARVPQDRIHQREAYEFFTQLSSAGDPAWSHKLEDRGAVFSNRSACARSHVTYNPGLKRYLLTMPVPGGDTRFVGGLAIYDAPEPWGPWTTTFYTDAWDVGPGESASFPSKWLSADGHTAWLAFSGDDNFSLRSVTFLPADAHPMRP